MSEERKFYSVREAAQRVGRSEKELLRLVAAAGIPMFQEGGRMVFKAEDIDWLYSNPAAGNEEGSGLFDLADLLTAAQVQQIVPPTPKSDPVLEIPPDLDIVSESAETAVAPAMPPVRNQQPTPQPKAAPGLPPPRGRGRNDVELSASGLFDQAEIAAAAQAPRPRGRRTVKTETDHVGSSSGLFNLTEIITEVAPSAKTKPIELDRIHRLFLDEQIVHHTHGTQIKVHHPIKHAANPVLLPDSPWEQDGYCSLGGTVLYDHDEKLFKMWYSALTKLGRAACYAISRDGVKWKKPALDHFPYRDKPTNIVMLHPTVEWFSELAGVIRDPVRAPGGPEARYKAAYIYANLRKGIRGLQTAISPDGTSWQSPEKLTAPQVRETATIMRDEAAGKYLVWGAVKWYGKKALLRVESEDFQHWTAGEPITWAGSTSGGPDLHSMTVFPYGGQSVGLLHVIHGAPENAVDVALTCSRDGWEWKRVGDGAMLPLGASGEWDRFAVIAGCPPLRVGKELWFYYGGRNYREVAAKDRNEPWGAIGLAKMRRDGFVSIGSGFPGGWIITKPVLPTGSTLRINAAAGFGELKVRVTDLAGNLLEGMDSEPITQDDVDIEVKWPKGKSLDQFRGRPIRLEFRMQNARMYSFWTQ